MPKRPGDTNPVPAGGRAAKRLEMFEAARLPDPAPALPPAAKPRQKKQRPKANARKKR
jgi:hypothetical protein